MKRLVSRAVRLPHLWRASRGNRLLAAEAVILLGVARFSVLTLPFRWTSAWLARSQPESAASTRPDPQEIVARVAAILPRVSTHTPWRSNCLAQGLAGHAMLRRRGVPSTLHLGVAKTGTSGLAAHAWLSCGDVVVTGARGHRRFTPLYAGGAVNDPRA